MISLVWVVGVPEPFRVKGEPKQVRLELLKHGDLIDGRHHEDGRVDLSRYPALVEFEHGDRREPVYINPNLVAAVAGPDSVRLKA